MPILFSGSIRQRLSSARPKAARDDESPRLQQGPRRSFAVSRDLARPMDRNERSGGKRHSNIGPNFGGVPIFQLYLAHPKCSNTRDE